VIDPDDRFDRDRSRPAAEPALANEKSGRVAGCVALDSGDDADWAFGCIDDVRDELVESRYLVCSARVHL
jgi:hypothetical protein